MDEQKKETPAQKKEKEPTPVIIAPVSCETPSQTWGTAAEEAAKEGMSLLIKGVAIAGVAGLVYLTIRGIAAAFGDSTTTQNA